MGSADREMRREEAGAGDAGGGTKARADRGCAGTAGEGLPPGRDSKLEGRERRARFLGNGGLKESCFPGRDFQGTMLQ